MVVSENVKRPMYHDGQHLLARADTFALCILAGNLGANIHVADHRSATSYPLQPEGDAVGCTVVTEVAFVETRHRGASDARDREHRILHLLRVKCGNGRFPYQR